MKKNKMIVRHTVETIVDVEEGISLTDVKYRNLCNELESVYGPPIEGSHRTVFIDKKNDEVIKVPSQNSGDFANQQELNTQGELYAKTKLDKELTERYGYVVIRMEYVEHSGYSKEPDWTWSIDCGQVGHTKDGRLVAYDWDTI